MNMVDTRNMEATWLLGTEKKGPQSDCSRILPTFHTRHSLGQGTTRSIAMSIAKTEMLNKLWFAQKDRVTDMVGLSESHPLYRAQPTLGVCYDNGVTCC